MTDQLIEVETGGDGAAKQPAMCVAGSTPAQAEFYAKARRLGWSLEEQAHLREIYDIAFRLDR